jgi:hypothetical protein
MPKWTKEGDTSINVEAIYPLYWNDKEAKEDNRD